jgi:acetyl esterase/lipase
VAQGKRSNKPFFSPREIKTYHISKIVIDQRDMWTMGVDLETHTHILYFHGGMYVIEGTGFHKRWLMRLYQRSDVKITYVDYPIAPESTVDEALRMVVDSYEFLVQQFPDDHFILMGDSAGGGLALVLAQYLRDHDHKKQPQKLILYSPWVRLDMQNPDISRIAPNDLILDVNLLKKSAKQYAGKFELSHKYLSPFFNSCQGLGEIHVFYGGDELLAPDITLFKNTCSEEYVKACFYCYEGLQHVFHLFPFLPESKDVSRRTLKILINHE